MATYNNGINGPFRGKVGKVVGATWKGIPYMRAMPHERTSAPTKSETANRNKFAKAHSWLQPVLEYVREGFRGYTDTVEGFLAAKSYLLKNAFESDGQNLVINPEKVKVSWGQLSLPDNIRAAKIAPGQIQFTWDISTVTDDNRYDQAMCLAYDVGNGEADYHVPGQPRMNGSDVIHVARDNEPRTYHLYIAFVSADRSMRSDSVYLGTIVC